MDGDGTWPDRETPNQGGVVSTVGLIAFWMVWAAWTTTFICFLVLLRRYNAFVKFHHESTMRKETQ